MERPLKTSAAMLASLLVSAGVSDAVVSPGSRNAPAISAFAHSLRLTVEYDERRAAFIALGMALALRRPVVLICTSGTALLNFAPALAEAYAEGVPLIAVSADRPERWIGQNDSQTLVQPGALATVVKATYDIADADGSDPEAVWYGRRQLCEAIETAIAGKPGPVHINMRFETPLDGTAPLDADFPAIERMRPVESVAKERLRDMAAAAASLPTMVVCGPMQADARVSKALGRMAARPNTVVLADALSGVRAAGVIADADLVLASCTDYEKLRPGLLISLGGAPLSARLKTFLRANPPAAHWHVGRERGLVDCFRALTCQIEMRPADFFPGLVHAMRKSDSPEGFSHLWHASASAARSRADAVLDSAPWSDAVAVRMLIRAVPLQYNLHVSNGLAVRLLTALGATPLHSVHCNRGVSGIDGCTSTALGYSLRATAPTLLLTGDMSLAYDFGPLVSNLAGPNLKIAVLRNGGGQIFRSIASTASNPWLEECFAADPQIDFRQVAEASRRRVWMADSISSLREALPGFLKCDDAPAFLEIDTRSADNTVVFHSLINC